MSLYELSARSEYAGVGSPGANVWHVRTATDPPDPTVDAPEDLIDAMQLIYVQLASFQPNTCRTLFPYTCRLLDPGNATTPDSLVDIPVTPVTHTGTQSQSELPERLAMRCVLQTLQPGRSGRGSKYFGPLAGNTLETNGTVIESARTSMKAVLDSVLDSLEGAGNGAIAVYSRKNHLAYDVIRGSWDNEFAQLSSRRF